MDDTYHASAQVGWCSGAVQQQHFGKAMMRRTDLRKACEAGWMQDGFHSTLFFPLVVFPSTLMSGAPPFASPATATAPLTRARCHAPHRRDWIGACAEGKEQELNWKGDLLDH
jgi:hypothetical protein